MSKEHNALVIGTTAAIRQTESGASLRLHSIGHLLEMAGFRVLYASSSDAKSRLASDWDLIAIVSFSSAKFLKLARKRTEYLWFDPTDSWSLSRLSLLRAGDLKQIPALVRDLFYLWTVPKLDMISFITKRDALSEQIWLRNRVSPLIIPNLNLQREVSNSNISRLVFMGDGNYLPNQKALDFLQKSFAGSELLKRLHVYGHDFFNASNGGIFHGYVDDNSQFRSDDIHLAPIFFGAGMKMKAAIPLINGLRVITTAEGAIGLKRHPNLHLARTSAEFQKVAQELCDQQPNEIQKPRIRELYMDDESDEALILLKQRIGD